MMDLDKLETKLPGVSKSKKKQKPTLRFELELPESTTTSCPEYSYVELVRQFLKEKKSKGENDSLCQNLLEEEEEKEKNEAEALAHFYEIKYGAGAEPGKGKKRKDRLKDLVDVGYGYDETDPFVDDSEAYDEIVPASLTTQHGGFYINTGKLEFRAVSDESDEDSVPLSQHISKKKKLKKLFFDSDESENEFKNEERSEKKKKKKKLKDHERKKKRKLSMEGKDKLSNLSKSSKKMKKSSASYAQKLVAKAKAQQMMNASAVGSPAHSTNGGLTPSRKSSTEDQMKSRLDGPGRDLGNIHDKDLAQVAKNVTKELMNVGGNRPDNDTSLNIEGMDTWRPNSSSPEYLELPPNLPHNLEDKIKSLKQIAKMAEGEGKRKFFSSDVNQILLEIEEESQNLRTKVRQGMYQNIAYHLPCSKDTLMKRAKKLFVNDWDQQVKVPLEKLRNAVDAVMTYQIDDYLQECAMQPFKGKTAASTDEDDECEDKSILVTCDGLENGGEKTKRTYAPRRKFKWDENLRNLLCQVVTVKMNQYEKCKVREKHTAEEYLKAFLDSEVKPLWPKPWMQTRILFKESRAAHSHLTLSSNCSKQKRVGSGKKGSGVTNVKQEKKALDMVQSNRTSVSSADQNLAYGLSKSTKKQLFQEESSAKQTTAAPHQVSGLPNKEDDISKMLEIASGSFELIASIEGENSPLASPVIAKNKEKIPEIPKSSATEGWKQIVSSMSASKLTSSSQNSPTTHPTTKVSSTNSKSKTIPATSPSGTTLSSGRRDKLPQPNPASSPYNMAASMEDPYLASEWIKMATSLMMGTSQMGMKSSVGYPPTAAPTYQPGMPNLNNLNVIQNILGLKPEDMVGHKQPSQRDSSHSPRANAAKAPDNKFQFKIVPPALPIHPLKKDKPSKSIDIIVNPEDLKYAMKTQHKTKGVVSWPAREKSQEHMKTVDLSRYSKTYSVSPSTNPNPSTSKLKQYSTAPLSSHSTLKKDQFISLPGSKHVKQFAPKNVPLPGHNYSAKGSQVSKGNIPEQSQTTIHTVWSHSYQKIPSHTIQHSHVALQSNSNTSTKLTRGVAEPHIVVPGSPSPHKLSQAKQGNVYSSGQKPLNKPKTCYSQTITSPISASSGFVLAHQGHMNFPSSLMSPHAYSSSSSNFFPPNQGINSRNSQEYSATTLNSMQNKASPSSLMPSQGKLNDMHDGNKGLFKPQNTMNHRFEGNHNR